MDGGTSQLISVHPDELQFQFELEKQCFCDLKLANSTEHHVAFKVKTTSPKKYCVRPNTGVIQPWDSCIIRVTLQAQKEYPPDMQCKDKFLLQSTKVAPNVDVDEPPPDTFNKESGRVIEELKLRVVYIPPNSATRNSEDNSKNFEANQALKAAMFKFQAQVEEINNELQLCERKKDIIKKSARCKLDELDKKKELLAKANDELVTLTVLLDNANVYIQQNIEQPTELNANKEEQASKIQQLEAAINERNNKIKDLETQNWKMTVKCSDQRNEIGYIKSTISELRDIMKEKDIKIIDQAKTISNLEIVVHELESLAQFSDSGSSAQDPLNVTTNVKEPVILMTNVKEEPVDIMTHAKQRTSSKVNDASTSTKRVKLEK